ncbi:hypothetical protein I1A62_01220 (plasmid) [Rhodococcus sp. USK10]|uniref:hypothetical protein n=1 Tax=Rhodococcus sp. USK10 TaxID=2789739 RepID=UPI001C5D0A39|nr:hypothetical protein [Rhodococcus sp. USK10]QYA99817.1 hypothetical protein I1A62_01220 [Rhodococcus sp. USK10]
MSKHLAPITSYWTVAIATRAARLERLSTIVAERIAQIQVAEWSAGFSIAVALILVLVWGRVSRRSPGSTDGTSPSPAATMFSCVSPSTVTGSSFPPPLEAPGIAVSTVYRGWTEVLEFLDRHHGATRPLGERAKAGGDLRGFDFAYQTDDRSLMTSINRWGHTPLGPATLTARAITAITQAHLSGRPGEREFESARTACPWIAAATGNRLASSRGGRGRDAPGGTPSGLGHGHAGREDAGGLAVSPVRKCFPSVVNRPASPRPAAYSVNVISGLSVTATARRPTVSLIFQSQSCFGAI